MAKQLNINLAFTADTTAAKQQLQQLQQQLNSLTSNMVSTKMPITNELIEAQGAARNLKIALSQAVNVDTGKFDLVKFNNSLKSSGTTLQQLRTQLSAIGPSGQQAFMTLAQSIMQAEVPVRRTNALLTQLGVTLKNTAKWQISSMVLHGFMNSISSAYNYAQDLNKSLNNIRIVTGHNVEYMEKFAAAANKSAKALSASTLDYTNASLIYYQQGLNDEQVKERTETTVKMANVLGESAKDVSSYMTAIWNNFDDGTKSLEYYGDAMAALGAATASSSAEIAQGLEKFVSIGKTVGLTYEYATAALATVVAKTRQSADTVGTAFKTIFSRLQGLQLGETLEDGTTLNKYSEALEVVGVDIKTSNGELKQMDVILDELGSKWQTLAQDEKMALAQTVAGVRQYTQLISLMDNYEDFKDNVSIAAGSSGTLDKQAETYAESWEAAQKRVKAAAESIYSSLLKDDFFISLLNGFEDFLSMLDKTIKSMGGLRGVMFGLSSVLLKTFSTQAAKGIQDMSYNLLMMSKSGQKLVTSMKDTAFKEAMEVSKSSKSLSQQATAGVMEKQLQLQRVASVNAENLTEAEKLRRQLILDQNKQYGDQYIQLIKNGEELKKQSGTLRAEAKRAVRTGNNTTAANAEKTLSTVDKKFTGLSNTESEIKKIVQSADPANIGSFRIEIEKLTERLNSMHATSASQTINEVTQAFRNGEITADQYISEINELIQSGDLLEVGTQDIVNSLNAEQVETEEARAAIENYLNKLLEMARNTKDATVANEQFNQSVDRSEKELQEGQISLSGWAQGIVNFGQKFNSVLFAFNALSSIMDTFKDKDMTFWEKFLSISMSLTMALPGIVTLITAMTKVIKGDTIVTVANTVAKIANALARKANAKAAEKEGKEVSENQIPLNKDTAKTAGEATKSLGKSFKTIGSSFKAMGVSLGGILAAVGMIALGIAIIAGGIAGLAAWWNKADKEAEEAAEQAEKLKESYQGIKVEYDNLKNTISDYSSAREGIDELTKGTVEFKQAIFEANEKASELINNYDGLQYSVNSDGLIEIDENSLKEIQNQELEKVVNAQNASMIADLNAKQKQLKADRIEMQREKLKASGLTDEQKGLIAGSIGTGASGGAAIGAGVGAIAGHGVWSWGTTGIGALIGAGIGAVSGGIGGGIAAAELGGADEREDQAIDAIYEAFQKEGNAIFTNDGLEKVLKENGITDKKLIDSILKEKESIEDLIISMDANTKQTKALNASMINNKYQSTYDEYELENASGQLIGNLLSDELKEKSDEYYEDEWKDQGGGLTDKEIQEQYAEAMGYVKFKNKGGNKAIYTDSEGEEHEIDDEIARKYLASQQALEEMDIKVKDMAELLSTVEDEFIVAAEDMSDYSDYEDVKNKITDKLSTIEGIEQDDIDNYISTFFAGNDYYKAEQKIKDNENKEEIEKWLQELSSEELDTFLTLKFDKDASIDELKNLLDKEQAYLDRQKLTVEIGGKFELAKLLEAGVYDDTLKEAFANAVFGKALDDVKDTDEFIDAWTAFLAKSRSEQLNEYGNNNINENDIWNDVGNVTAVEDEWQEKQNDLDSNYSMDYNNWLNPYKNVESFYGGTSDVSEIIAGGQQELINRYNWFLEEEKKAKERYESVPHAYSWQQSEDRDILFYESGLGYLQDFYNSNTNSTLRIEDFANLPSEVLDFFYQAQPNQEDYQINQEKYEEELEKAKSADLDAYRKNFASLLENSDLEAEEVYELSDAYESYAGVLEDVSDDLKDNEKWANRVAYKQSKQEKNLSNLYDNWEDLEEIVTSNTTSSTELNKAYEEISEGISGLVGAQGDYLLSNSFISENFDLVRLAIEGNVEAIESLRQKAAEDIFLEISGVETLDELNSDIETVYQDLNQFAEIEELQFGDILDPEQLDIFKGYCQTLIETAGWTEQEVIAAFSRMNYELTFGANGELIEVGYANTAEKVVSKLKDSAEEIAKNTQEEIKAEKERLKGLDDEIDRYHTIKELQDDISKEMDKVSKLKDRAYGKDKLAYLDAEIAGYDAQIAAQDKLIESTQAYLNLDKERLNSFGVQFSASGDITNYEELQNSYLQRLASTDSDSADYVALESEYELFKSYVEKYEGTLDEYEQAITDKTDAQLAKLDAQMEGITYSVEIKLDVNDTELEKLQFILDQLDNPYEDAIKIIDTYTKMTEKEFNKMEINSQGIKDILSLAGATTEQINQYLSGDASGIIGLELTEDQISELASLTSGIAEYQSNILGYRDAIYESLPTAFDEAISKFDSLETKLDSFVSITDSYKNMIDIIGKDSLGISDAFINDLNKTVTKITQTKIQNAKSELEFSEHALVTARLEYDKAVANGDEEMISYWEDEIERLEDESLQKVADLNSLLEEGMQKAADAFADALEKAFEHLDDVLAGSTGSLDELMSNFEKQQKISERYLDNGEKLYNISKLNRQIQKDIDKTDNLKAKKELAKLQEEINSYSKEDAKLSERDLEALQKKYDLKLAEIALEEAQNAKSQVRMTRDNEGNWSYTYVADENNIADAEQNYEDKLEENRQFGKDQDSEITSQIIQNRQELKETLQEIRRQDYENEVEYYNALKEAAQFYIDQEQYLISQLSNNVSNSRTIFEEFYNGNLYDAQDWLSGFNLTMEQMGISYDSPRLAAESLKNALGGFEEGEGGLYAEIAAATQQWQEDVSYNMELAGLSVDTFKETVISNMYGEGGSINKPTGGVIAATIGIKDEISNLQTKSKSDFSLIASSVSTWQVTFSKKVEAGNEDVINLYNSLAALKEDYSEVNTNVNVDVTDIEGKFSILIDNLKTWTGKTHYIDIETRYKENNNEGSNEGVDPESSTLGGIQKSKSNLITIGERDYVQVDGKWYSKGSISTDDWNTIKTAETFDATLLNNGFEYSDENINRLQAIKNKFSGRGHIGELTKDTILYSQYSQAAGGFINSNKINYIQDSGNPHPDLSYENDVVYSNGEYYVKVKVTGDASNTVVRGSKYWVPLTYINKPGSTGYYGYSDFPLHGGAGRTIGGSFNIGGGSFDTGGYTGDWGNEGRLAVLHQKEIVLNASDTENFLRAVEIVREIAGIIDLNAQSASQGLVGVRATNVLDHNQKFEQNVQITAEFPNVNNHYEIEEAFNNLINDAAQYIMRK